MHVLKSKWKKAFLDAGIDESSLNEMGISEFCSTCSGLISSGVFPPLISNKYSKNKSYEEQVAIQIAMYNYHTILMMKRLKKRGENQEFVQGSDAAIIAEQDKMYYECLEGSFDV